MARSTGLSLATVLAKKYEVVIIEKNNQLGGSWNSDFYQGYWRKFSKSFRLFFKISKKFFKDIGITENDLSNIYGMFFKQI